MDHDAIDRLIKTVAQQICFGLSIEEILIALEKQNISFEDGFLLIQAANMYVNNT